MAPCDVLLSVEQTPHRLRRRALVTWTPAQELNEGARAWRGGSSGTTSWGSASAGCSARASSSAPARWRATRPAPPCSPPTSSPACPRCCPAFATPNRRARPRRRRRLQLPQSNLRRVRGVLRGRQHPHGVRAVQRGGGEEFHRLPGVDVRRHGAQRVEGRGGGHRQGLQRARFPRRRAHSPPHRMPLLQHQGELDAEHGAHGVPPSLLRLHHRGRLLERQRAEHGDARRAGALRRPGRPRRRGRRLLQLHRLRLGVHHGRGDQGPRPCAARRHRRLGAHRLRALLPHVRRALCQAALHRDRRERALLVGIQGQSRVEVGEQRRRGQRQHRHRGVAAGGHAGAGEVPVRHRQGEAGAGVAGQGPSFHRHSYERHHLSRILHGINRTLHRAADSVRDGIDRNTRGHLPGGQRAHLPPVHQARSDAAAPRPPLPAGPDAELSRLLPLGEDRRQVAMGDGTVRRGFRGVHRDIPLHGATGRGRATVGVDGSSDAMAGGCVRLPECVPHDNPEGEVLSEVWHMEPRDNRLLRVLWGALHIHCGGK